MKRWMTMMLTMLWFFSGLVQAKGPEALTDLEKALEQAKKEKKMLFIQCGREACGNCQALRGYIRDGTVRLAKSAFVYVDLNCDDPASSAAFNKKFKVKGDTLPFVVVASPDGDQLAAKAGFGTPDEYEALIKQAKKKKN